MSRPKPPASLPLVLAAVLLAFPVTLSPRAEVTVGPADACARAEYDCQGCVPWTNRTCVSPDGTCPDYRNQ